MRLTNDLTLGLLLLGCWRSHVGEHFFLIIKMKKIFTVAGQRLGIVVASSSYFFVFGV